MARRRSTGRRPGPRREHPALLILCEGETEEAYFDGLRRHLRSTRPLSGRGPEPMVEVAKRTEGALIVREAMERRTEGYSEMWAVFDTEGEDVGALRRKARDTPCKGTEAAVETAVSHPCFEVWLLLHHMDRGRLTGCHTVRDTVRLLEQTVPEWAKGSKNRGRKGTDFADFAPGVERARRQGARTPRDRYDDYPWTDVHLVLDSLENHLAHRSD
ncbi:RloB-like protein [Nocardiopsis flavescens]|uniref:RloB-like protein n=1 Tax=Nocardiopsis flavescens TaxID=758803 RepID=A0A1M6GMB5_9ACTN|nr:RloB family protein [Nocardiopsis flavescens]SHJ11080.1 RloB-like protein [Nocardiopsis flavescens]